MDDDPPAGVPEWVVTYGDMMSLLLTFFIMLVSLSEVVADKQYRAILEAFHQYLGYHTAAEAPPGKHFPLNSRTSGLETLGAYSRTERGRGGIKAQGADGRDFRVFRMPEGTPLLLGEVVEFAPGRIDLDEIDRGRIAHIADELAGKPNKVEIRAHAAPGPLPAEALCADKVLLTYERARVVVAALERLGIERDRLRITAAADTEPLPESGDRSALRHDRVEVLMLDTLAEDYVGPKTVTPGSGP